MLNRLMLRANCEVNLGICCFSSNTRSSPSDTDRLDDALNNGLDGVNPLCAEGWRTTEPLPLIRGRETDGVLLRDGEMRATSRCVRPVYFFR